jgi:hypothetical protein
VVVLVVIHTRLLHFYLLARQQLQSAAAVQVALTLQVLRELQVPLEI